jgi:hypothetical protein
MIFTSAIISLLAVVPAAVKAVPVIPHQDGLFPRQAADIQKLLAVDPSQVATGSEQDGQGADVADNQVRSKTSFNNFANFCLTQDVPLTDGQQIKTGSCNPTIMGVIASTSNMPRSRFEFPKNGQVIQANTAFTLRMKIGNLQTGNFVNPQTNYYAAPQTVNGGGDIIGHSHVTIQKMDKVDQPDPLDPSVFAFFKGFNGVAQGGVLTADVPAPGLPEGFYRMCSINTAANHQPVLVAVAQHGSLDDCVYFQCAAKASNTPFFNNGANTAGAGGAGNNGNNNGNGNGNNGGKGGDKTAASSSAASSSSSSAPPAATNGNNGNKGGAQGNNGGQANNGQKGGAQANNGGANNNNNKGQAAQQAADKAKQAADAKKAAEDQKKAQDAAKAAAGANGKQAAAQQAADKAKQAADAKKAAEDQKKAQQQSNKGGKKNRRSLRFQRD